MELEVNGKRRTLACSTAFEARALLGSENDIVILNGFQFDGDCLLAENDALTIIRRGAMPARDELEGMMAARHTPAVHKRLKQGKVAIAGLGGLGSNIAVMLARIGVGELLLVDFDVVEPSNLNRQSYYIRHLGMPKTLALQGQLAEINPFVTVRTRAVRVEEGNVAELFAGCDILCEAFDRPEAKAMLVNTALEKLPGVRIVAASGMAGYASANAIRTMQTMERLYVCGDGETGAAAGIGLMAPRVQVCAGHQANMVLRLLVGEDEV
jgi:sulfur carrier protein ThiS adenylyltransferase